jgi:hypothetical protein
MTWIAVGWVSNKGHNKGKNERTRGGCEEDGSANGFEEIEILAGLYKWNEGGRGKRDGEHTACVHFVSKKATAYDR